MKKEGLSTIVDGCFRDTDSCKTDVLDRKRLKSRVPEIAEKIIAHCNTSECYTHIDNEPIPSEGFAAELIESFREIIFPGYFSKEKLDPVNMKYSLGRT